MSHFSLQLFSQFAYNNTLILTPPATVPEPVGLAYDIIAGAPLPSSSYTLSFSIIAERRDTNTIYTVVTVSWFIPVLGSISAEVPNFHPVASDPTMIFLVLRDPPGGSSYTEFTANSDVSLDLGVDHFDTFVAFSKSDIKVEVGSEENLGLVEGIAIAQVMYTVKEKAVDTFQITGGNKFTSERASSSHYIVSMLFSFDIQISQNPQIAGHLNDIIVGGGVDLVVSQAIRGNYSYSVPVILNILNKILLFFICTTIGPTI